MKWDYNQLRNLYSTFWTSKGHIEIPAIPLVPKDDPTTLFTGSGMQQLVPYLLGEKHPLGSRLYNIQRCIRAQDIEEVGDNRHDSFFEMMGNWSLGDYFKKEQLTWFASFLIDVIKLNPRKLYVTVFSGDAKNNLPPDEESIQIWKDIFNSYGIDAQLQERIFPYGPEKNWWSRAGTPTDMPAGEPGGPDSEVFFEFSSVPHNPKYGPKCHPNCDCGRFLEIGNSVFMQYKKNGDDSFSPLPKMNVDFGGGLERLVMATENNPDMFATSLYQPLITKIETITKATYSENKHKPSLRIIADHVKAAVFLIKDGVFPSNKEQGYVLRRLLRRMSVKLRSLIGTLPSPEDITTLATQVISLYGETYFNQETDSTTIGKVIFEEVNRFNTSMQKGLKLIEKLSSIDAKKAFDLYQSYGFPLEITQEIFQEKGQIIDRNQFAQEFKKHQELSRSASAGKFKGGLADQSVKTIKYHTATHLLHQALFSILGKDIRQEGSNITSDRLRFDFYSVRKPTAEDIQLVEKEVNKVIEEKIPVQYIIMPKKAAEKIGAKSFFREKYPDMVKIYFIGSTIDAAYSKEFCGGPHVKNTEEIGPITLYKLEKIGSNLYRVYARGLTS